MNKESYFDGGLLSFIGHSIVAFFIITLTLGIATPWAVCFMQDWKVRHTVIDGQRLYLMELVPSYLEIGSNGSY